ncbi:MAG: hypothetical protein HY675_20830 [Chloroflexi bacterium]|nr:hypothetical protein [Chloroflexota bacterium]
MTRRSMLLVSLAVVGLLMILTGGQRLADPAVAQVPTASSTDTGMVVTVGLSAPANGSFLVPGERAVIAVTLRDKLGASLTRNDFATLNLYMYGPQETTKTVTAVKLLDASTDRAATPHHYIDLLKDARVQVDGATLRYTLQPVSSEEPGTYTASLWAVKKGDPPVNQAFALSDFQLGTATVEKQIVEKENCARCHLGADNGQFYLHHVDPGRSPYGSPSIDSIPVRTCKSCHNNEGYAAYPGNIEDPAADLSTTRTPDPIVRRVHGVHMGEELKNPFNTDPDTGSFKFYTSVIFPANVKNCTTCHVDNRWKTQPSRQACGACHDNVWFGETAAMPANWVAHPGGPQANDSGCASCHPADTGGLKPVAEAHRVSQPMNEVAVSITPPANGRFYAAGDTPVVTMVIKDDAGNPIDHTQLNVANFSTAGLFVYGNRAQSVPVLTSIAKNGFSKLRASLNNSIAASGSPERGWTFAAGDTFKIAVNSNPPVEIAAPAGFQTPNQVRNWLASRLSGVTVTATATNVGIRSNIQGERSSIDIYDSAVTKIMGWKNPPRRFSRGVTAGVTMEPYVNPARLSYPVNDLRKLSDPLDYEDPAVTRNVDSITYQLDDVAGLPRGTYMVYVWIQPVAGRDPNFSRPAIGFMTFQVGTATEEKLVATNCKQCHGETIWHLDEGPQHPEPFDPDYCKACHDYTRLNTGDSFAVLGGTSQNGWSGYGAVPIVRRVHGVHRGLYLEHPEAIYAGNPDAFSEVIFPQDIRNCTKCHDPKGSAAWKEKPSRLACMSCHDSAAANGHAQLNTLYTTPDDPWSADRVETCKVCHGAEREFSATSVHNISNPYKPPYPREPER